MAKTGKHVRESGRMTKKRIAAAAVCCALMAGGTLAYFTAEERAHNVITSGGVDIELNEYTIEDGTLVAFPEDGIDGVMPGMSVDKIVEVENTGASPAWVRIKVEETFVDGVGNVLPDVMTLDTPSGDDAPWVSKADEDGAVWWYYVDQLAPGETTTPLFSKVMFHKTDMDNAYQNGKAIVDVSAQAVQIANNGASALEATGWPEN